ncbi:unnamed protein product [Linum trigynum]|uniref:Reverse transcriptase zinc-binding domain-containing protein n=1 Tax=Linum trigynum TaxID=586398 RepID=A0AAV2FY27_9ROSI
MDVIKRRGTHLANRYTLCHNEEENADHIFTRCEFIQDAWSIIKAKKSFIGNLQGDVSSVISNRPSLSPNNIDEWFNVSILHAVFWSVWLQRNQRIFKNYGAAAMIIARKSVKMVVYWLTAHHKIDKEHAASWLAEFLS